LALLETLLRQYAETEQDIPSDVAVIETFLAVSKFGPLARRHLILSVVDQLLMTTANAHLQAEAVYQRSVVMRLQGDIADSSRLLEEFLNRPNTSSRLESSSVHGLLHLSQAANYAYKFDFISADKQARQWNPQPSRMEQQLDVVWGQIHSAGKILRGQANFVTACQFFERCLQMEPLRESKRYLALSHLADTYVEVDYLRRLDDHPLYAGELLKKAEGLIRPEVERLRSYAPHSKGFRRLLLSLSEIEIRQGGFAEAEHLLMELCGIYDNLAEPDIVDRHGHLRTLIALARVSPVLEAEARWCNALNLGRKYYPLEEEVFIVALIHFFICVARLQQGNVAGGKVAFEYAEEICRTKPPQFLMPGLGTYLLHDVQYRIESIIGWRLPWSNYCI
jgi:tetratricopeptide (TPR) repeat protein